MRSLLLMEYLGPVVISITPVFSDILRVALIYLVVWGAHAMCAWSMFKPFQDQQNRTTKYHLVKGSDFETQRGFFVSTIWRILFADSPEAVHVKALGHDEDFSLEFSHAAGIVIWLSYQIIMSVLMINILVAIMNTTYSEVWQSAESEWKFERTRYLVGLMTHFLCNEYKCISFSPLQAEFIAPRASFPSPLRFLYYMAKGAYKYKCKCCCKNPNLGKKGKGRLEKIKYFELLNQLIQRRKHLNDKPVGVNN